MLLEPLDAAYFAGIQLTLLEQAFIDAPPWLGAWRDRLAVEVSAAACAKAGRRERESEIRMAVHFGFEGGGKNTGARLFTLWRDVPVTEPEPWWPHFGLLSQIWGSRLAEYGGFEWIWSAASDVISSRRAAPLAAANMFAAVVSRGRELEILAAFMADLVLAKMLNWPYLVPLFALGAARTGWLSKFAAAYGEAWDWPGPVCAVYAMGAQRARELAQELAVSADRLLAGDAGEDLGLQGRLLKQDALFFDEADAARAQERRWFGEMVEAGCVRELLAHESMRLYGL